MKTEPISIDGVAGPVVVTAPFWGFPVVSVGGVPAPRTGRQYALPAAVGGAVQATVRTGFADPYPTLEVNGVRHRTGPAVPAVLQVLTLLPIVLVGIGGAFGGLIGALAVVANLSVSRTRNSSVVKALIMVGMAVAAYFVWFAIVDALIGLR